MRTILYIMHQRTIKSKDSGADGGIKFLTGWELTGPFHEHMAANDALTALIGNPFFVTGRIISLSEMVKLDTPTGSWAEGYKGGLGGFHKAFQEAKALYPH